MKCIVYGCNNLKRDGMFYGGICATCYEHLTTGVVGPTDSFLNGFYELRKYAEEINLPNKNIVVQQLIESHRNLRKSNKEYFENLTEIIKSTRKEAWKKAYEEYNRTELIHIDVLRKTTIEEISKLIYKS